MSKPVLLVTMATEFEAVDAAGHVCRALMTDWRGYKLLHVHEFREMGRLLESLRGYRGRQGDIWITSYPKTGRSSLGRVAHPQSISLSQTDLSILNWSLYPQSIITVCIPFWPLRNLPVIHLWPLCDLPGTYFCPLCDLYSLSGTNWLYEIVSILLSGRLEPVPRLKTSDMLEMFDDISKLPALPAPRVINTHIHIDLLPSEVFKVGKTMVPQFSL